MFMFDAGQSLIEPLELERELFVVDSHAVQYGCIDVVDVNRVFDDVVTEVIGFAVDESLFYSAACHPHAEVSWMVIASIIVFGQRPLRVHRPAEFASPNNQRAIEQAPLFEVLN